MLGRSATPRSAQLADAAVPPEIRMASDLDLPPAQTEIDVLAELRAIGQRNRVMKSMIGLGYYATHTPQVVLRKVLENPAWYTAYTPYQPEISQGRLEALLNFQTMVADLSGLPAANASLLDEATAAAEAMGICLRASKAEDASFVVDADCLPQTIAVVRTRAEPLGITRGRARPRRGPARGCDLRPAAAVPRRERRAARPRGGDRRGARARRARRGRERSARRRALPPARRDRRRHRRRVVAALRRAAGLRRPARRLHVRARRASSASFPAASWASRSTPTARPALRLALQTREQHIRREKATSNICTAQVLLAVMASMYAVYHGREGLEAIANRVHRFASILAEGLRRGGLELIHDAFFDTIQVRVPHHADAVVAAARQSGVNLRRVDSDTVGIACDEVTERPEIEASGRPSGCGRTSTSSTRRSADSIPAGAAADERLPHASGLQGASLRDADAALPAPPLRPGCRARPLDDPARLLHDEAERDHRDAGRSPGRSSRACIPSRRSTRPTATSR